MHVSQYKIIAYRNLNHFTALLLCATVLMHVPEIEMLLPDVSFPLISQSEPSANEFVLILTNEQSNVSESVGKLTAKPSRL